MLFLGLMRMRSKDSYRLSRQKGDTPAGSEDELEAETSFSTFKPKEGFVNPLHGSLLESPSVSGSAGSKDSSPGEGALGARKKQSRRAMVKKIR